MSSADPRASGGASYRMLRELGARSQPSYAAIREPTSELVVVQRFERVALPAASMALLLRDARCLEKNWHPNIARVRHVDLTGTELTIATELLDGATFADLVADPAPLRTNAHDPPLPLPVLVRILLDVLAGLHALHGLRDGMNAPLGAIHGALCPANIVVGKDGVARLIDALRPRPVQLAQASDAAGYAAPEVLDAGGTDDPRADLYSVGVILWEALAVQRLFDEIEPARVLSRQREDDIAPPELAPGSPFAALADVAMRALEFDPALRFRGAAEMAAELRKIAGAHLASGGAVAAQVLELAGDRIRARRALLDPVASGTRRRASQNAMPAVPVLSPPVPRRANVVRASPRVVAPTLNAAVPVALLAASRPSMPDLADDTREEDDAEVPGPRASTPELDLESALVAAIAAAQTRHAERAAAVAEGRPISPVTPNLPFPRRPEIVLSRRAPPKATNETPGELVVPISVRPAPASRALVALVLMTALVAIVAGAAVALRMRASGEERAAATGLTEPPPAVTEVVPSIDTAPIVVPPPPVAAPIGPPTSRAITPRAPVPAPAPAPAPTAKPKKSVYEPDGL